MALFTEIPIRRMFSETGLPAYGVLGNPKAAPASSKFRGESGAI